MNSREDGADQGSSHFVNTLNLIGHLTPLECVINYWQGALVEKKTVSKDLCIREVGIFDSYLNTFILDTASSACIILVAFVGCPSHT